MREAFAATIVRRVLSAILFPSGGKELKLDSVHDHATKCAMKLKIDCQVNGQRHKTCDPCGGWLQNPIHSESRRLIRLGLFIVNRRYAVEYSTSILETVTQYIGLVQNARTVA